MGWQSVDARSHPDDEWINGDPAEIPSPGDLLAELARRPAWHADALCREYPSVNFFPERGESNAEAKAVCARCVVRTECHQAAQGEAHGIWAGTSPAERRKARSAGHAA